MCSFNKVLNQVGQRSSQMNRLTFHQDTQVLNISGEIDTTAAPADTNIDEQFARAKSLADCGKAN